MKTVNLNWTFEDLDLQGAHSELSAEYEKLRIIVTFLNEKSEKLNVDDSEEYKIWKFIYDEEKVIWEKSSKIHRVICDIEHLMNRGAK